MSTSFELTPESVDAAGLAATIFSDHCTNERLRTAETTSGRFDRDLWGRLGEAGLLGLPLPEEHGGSDLGLLELCSVLVEAGRKVAPVPLGTHGVAAMALARFGSADQRARWLPRAATGEAVLTCAVSEEREHAPDEPVTRGERSADGWVLTGAKTVVPAGGAADLFVVPARTAQGTAAFLVLPGDPGVTVLAQELSGRESVAHLVLDDAALPPDRVLGEPGDGAATCAWLTQHLTVALCAEQLGTLEGALSLTADYAKTREQFGRPIGTFQAVSQRLADGYIDVLGARLTLWQAAWRLSERRPAAYDVATAKLWAADAGHRAAHTTVHVHGGVGIDLDGEAHRYFTAAKRHEFLLGGTTDQARAIGRLMAAEQE